MRLSKIYFVLIAITIFVTSPSILYAQSLLNSREFPSNSFKPVPQWSGVLDRMKGHKPFLDHCQKQLDSCVPGYFQTWNAAVNPPRTKNFKRILNFVNRKINSKVYRLDDENYGVSEYWADVKEFLEKSGDCEDYSIAKYYALKSIGIPIDTMRIVAVKDRLKGGGHAILVVEHEGLRYVLDNLSAIVFTEDRLPHYIPQFSVNEEKRWTHFPLK